MLILFTPYPDHDIPDIGDACEEIPLPEEDDDILDTIWEDVNRERIKEA